jgi:hypothetical protein
MEFLSYVFCAIYYIHFTGPRCSFSLGLPLIPKTILFFRMVEGSPSTRSCLGCVLFSIKEILLQSLPTDYLSFNANSCNITIFFSVVESQNMNPEDPDLLEVLEQENKRLAKRIRVCKSRVMLVTSFDILPQRSKL